MELFRTKDIETKRVLLTKGLFICRGGSWRRQACTRDIEDSQWAPIMDFDVRTVKFITMTKVQLITVKYHNGNKL